MPHAGPLSFTRERLLELFGFENHPPGERKLTSEDIDIIEGFQIKRNPHWKNGDPMLVYWKDIADLTGAKAYIGNF